METLEQPNRGSSIFASKAEIGKRYLTSAGHPVEVITATIRDEILVRSLLRGTPHKIPYSHLLFPYQKEKINQEAIAMANAEKKAGGNTSPKSKEVKGPDRGISREGSKIVLMRRIKEVVHEVTFIGKVLEYKGKEYTSLKDVASAIRGKAISGSGRSFFGLRTTGNIELGREVIKGLDEAKPTKPAKEPKKDTQKGAHKSFPKPGGAKKSKKAKDEDDEEEPCKSTVGAVVAQSGVSARGRGR